MTGRVLTFGETMGLAVNEDPGPLSTAHRFTVGFGGAESNVAIALARLGVPVTWVSRVGDDPVGTSVVRGLRAEGVDARVAVDSDRPTGFMLKERRTRTISSVTYWRAGSAASAIAPEDIPDDLLHEAALLHVTGITPALSASALSATFNAVERARAAGITVSFDVNHRGRLWPAAAASEVYRRLAASADVVFAGADEAALLVGEAEPMELGRRVAGLGAGDVVIKLGADGCVAVVDGAVHTVSAVPVDVVDTVGAGDAFVAGYLAELLAGADVTARLRTAVKAGAFACAATGDWEASPTRAELARMDAAEGVAR